MLQCFHMLIIDQERPVCWSMPLGWKFACELLQSAQHKTDSRIYVVGMTIATVTVYV